MTDTESREEKLDTFIQDAELDVDYPAMTRAELRRLAEKILNQAYGEMERKARGIE